jgi:hypothetical protein
MKVADANFEQHLDHYRTGCNFSLAKYLRGVLASMFLLASLDMQASLFELIMKENAQSMLQKLITFSGTRSQNTSRLQNLGFSWY